MPSVGLPVDVADAYEFFQPRGTLPFLVTAGAIDMALKQRFETQLKHIRGISEAMLAVLNAPEEWCHQVHPDANHPLWFMGHIGTVDNFMLETVGPERVLSRDGYWELFGMGSRPTPNPDDYPPVDEVRRFFDDRRKALLGALGEVDEARLLEPVPEGLPEFLTDVASVFETAVWHEAMHLGQVTVARRSLGHRPLVDG